MLINERHNQIIQELQANPGITVKELAKKLQFSEPTIRRDFTELHAQGVITKRYGGAVLKTISDNCAVPFVLRENEKGSAKATIGMLASQYIRDGMCIMLDGSTSAYHLIPYISKYKDIVVVTCGAKTAVALAELNIPVYCTGGQMQVNGFSYAGRDAEEAVRHYNADILFFSCRGLSAEGMMSDPSIEQAHMCRAMMEKSKQKYLLCDSSKLNNTYFYDMGNVSELDGVVSNQPLPESITSLLRRK